ncbi:MAG: mannose-1-phosphate guanylyltransferase [Planctomycetota bacterium]|jgi:mannose-1-phosphate guanylyltransferase|nr:mannose-1-phosphate guanylyltransferase [Planctomycetota bacterium]
MFHVIIMAGGSGTRFWPESRQSRPKQLLPILGAEPLITETANRLSPLVPHENIWVVTNQTQASGVRAALPDIPESNILLEPCARNTAPCVGLAAAVIQSQDPDATLAFLPADHQISPPEDFQRALRAGAAAAETEGVFVTFGVPPTHAATGYGYIHRGELIGEHESISCFAVESFKEKPDADTAKEFLRDGNYLWNSGIFVWKASTILNAIKEHMPDLATGLDRLVKNWGEADWASSLEKEYPSFPSVPVDIGIMEKVSGVQVLETPFHWSDIGSWHALYDELEKDSSGNVSVLPSGGQLMAHDSSGVLAYSSKNQMIAVLGLDDVVVVQSGDAILIAKRNRSEDVKLLTDRLREMGEDQLL